mgnify:CR=1 FL=1
MIDISLSNITVNYGFKDILKNISFDINKNEIISLIGSNGSGKTTLLNIISGVEKPTSGIVSIRKNTKIGYLTQMIDYKYDMSVKDVLYNSLENIKEIESKMKKYEEKMLNLSGKELDKIIIK